MSTKRRRGTPSMAKITMVLVVGYCVSPMALAFLGNGPNLSRCISKRKLAEEDSFDIRMKWEQAKQEAGDLWNDILPEPSVTKRVQQVFFRQHEERDVPPWLESVGKHVSSLLQGGTDALDPILSALTNDDDQDEEERRAFLPEVLSILLEYKTPITSVVKTYLGDLDFTKLNPSSLWYYSEYEEERKNAGWKRRMHRYYDKVDVNDVQLLNEMMLLAGLSYTDTVEDIQEGLDQCSADLQYAQLDCEPAKPSHFIAVPRRQSKSDPLEVWLVVRGTKTLADAVTDLCANTVDYREGKAHEFMLKSGQYLVEKHAGLFEELRQKAGAPSIQLTVVGHSLGAGAAAFVALELQDEPNIDVQVYGFGTPTVVSEDLAQDMESCMVTVVADSDVVPRLNGVTLANALLDVMEFDYRDRAERDLVLALQELKRGQPLDFSDEMIDAATKLLEPLLDAHMELALPTETAQRLKPVLFPPGKCIHFYRDGFGVSGRYVPNTFFREIDVTRRMISDHVRFGYEQIFHDLMRQHFQDLYYTFDSTKLELVSDFNKQARKSMNEETSREINGKREIIE